MERKWGADKEQNRKQHRRTVMGVRCAIGVEYVCDVNSAPRSTGSGMARLTACSFDDLADALHSAMTTTSCHWVHSGSTAPRPSRAIEPHGGLLKRHSIRKGRTETLGPADASSSSSVAEPRLLSLRFSTTDKHSIQYTCAGLSSTPHPPLRRTSSSLCSHTAETNHGLVLSRRSFAGQTANRHGPAFLHVFSAVPVAVR